MDDREPDQSSMTMYTLRYVTATMIAVAIVAAAHASAGRTRPNEQVFVTPRAQAENVRFAQPRPGLIEVTYGPVSDDPRAVFSVTLDASDDGGQTWNVKPKNMTGDVGANVTPGTGKRIVWEAGKDVEVLKFDQFRFRLNPVAARLPPLRTATGGLSVQTTPAGATGPRRRAIAWVDTDGDWRPLARRPSAHSPPGRLSGESE